jgi:hypothetical protein
MLFCCRACGGDPCELRIPGGEGRPPPECCPFDWYQEPRWHELPSGRSAMPRAGLELLPGPFCEIPATAIARATAGGGRYTIEIGGIDRLEIPVSRTAFNAAVTAMEEAGRDAVD